MRDSSVRVVVACRIGESVCTFPIWVSLGADGERRVAVAVDAAAEKHTAAWRRSVPAFLDGLESHAHPSAELTSLAQDLTVPETHFFRHVEQLRACVKAFFAERVVVGTGSRSLTVFSAGCASGEEPHSLAILAQETFRAPGWTILLRAAAEPLAGAPGDGS